MSYAQFDAHEEAVPEQIVENVLPEHPPTKQVRFHLPKVSQMTLNLNFRSGQTGHNSQLFIFTILLAILTIVILSVTVAKLSGGIPPPYPNLCTNQDCLVTAGEAETYMNLSIDPCVDFYAYACGNFAQRNPIPSGKYEVDPWSLLQEKNNDRILDILEDRVQYDKSASDKAKLFYRTCKNDYYKSLRGSAPLLSEFARMGGWSALTVMNPTFELNAALQQAHAKFGAHVFFQIDVQPDQDSAEKGHPAYNYTIEINIPKLGLGSWSTYLKNDSASQHKQSAYKRFIKSVLTTMRQESKFVVAGSIDNAVADIYAVELIIAQAIAKTVPTKGIYKPISYIDDSYGKKISWFDLLSAYFKEANLERSKIVHLHEEAYVKAITTEAVDLVHDRMLNAYVMWSIAQRYVNDMGWQYVHANRRWSMVKHNYNVKFIGTYKWCQRTAKRNFGAALSAQFVARHFGAEDNQQLNSIAQHMKDVLVRRIKGYSWMSDKSKAMAIKKVQNTKDKFGYPAFYADQNAVDKKYEKLVISFSNSHFANMLALNDFRRYQETLKVIQQSVDYDYWPENIYDVAADYDVFNNYLYVPAGILQPPIYAVSTPLIWSYGTIGRLLGSYMVRAIDDEGRSHDEQGVISDWWDDETNATFTDRVMACQEGRFVNETVGDWPVNKEKILARYAWRELAGLKTAYMAYQEYAKRNGKELYTMPGFHKMSTMQSFFVSFAQTFCYNRPSWLTWLAAMQYGEPEELILRKVLAESPEFASTFQCPLPQSTCPGF